MIAVKRADAFKSLNNPIVTAPASAAGTSNFRSINGTIDNTRLQLQLALKLSF
jgi:hypothetical protein